MAYKKYRVAREGEKAIARYNNLETAKEVVNFWNKGQGFKVFNNKGEVIYSES